MSIARTSGFADPVHDSQSTFRAIMRAMARPGTIEVVSPDFAPPPSLSPAAAAACLALADFETPALALASLAADAAISDYLRFHTGAPASTQQGAAFALVHAGKASSSASSRRERPNIPTAARR